MAKDFTQYVRYHKSLPKPVAKEILWSVLSNTEEIDNEKTRRIIDCIISYWKPFASYWTKDTIIDEDTDSEILEKFMELSDDRKRFLALETNMDGLIPIKDKEAFFDHLESVEADEAWKINVYLRRIGKKLYASQTMEYTTYCDTEVKSLMNTNADDLNAFILGDVTTAIVKCYLKHGETNLAEAHLSFISKKVSQYSEEVQNWHKQWLFKLNLQYCTFIDDFEAINKLRVDFITRNQQDGRWSELVSEISFYNYLFVAQMNINKYSALMKSLDKLVMLNKKVFEEEYKNETWWWTKPFNRSRQVGFYTKPYPFEFRFNFYKQLLDNQLCSKGFRLLPLHLTTDTKSFNDFDIERCAPTILLDLCLEALLTSVDKYEEAYVLCVGLIAENDWYNKNLFRKYYTTERYFSKAFDAYVQIQNQQANIPTGFSATQRFRELYASDKVRSELCSFLEKPESQN